MTSRKTEISVIIPAFKAERYLADAIESVFSQTLLPCEVIVVDDGSPDETLSLARSFGEKVKIVSQPHAGAAAARNNGVRCSKGHYIAFLDADDLWPTQKLSKQIETLLPIDGPDAVFGMTQQFISPELSQEEKNKLLCPKDPMPGYIAGCLLISKAIFLKVGAFNETLAQGEFIDWYSRAMALGIKFAVPDEVFLFRRIHASNTVLTNIAARNADYLRAVRLHHKRMSRIEQE